MMEAGNLLFGNSRGKYEIQRGVLWESEIIRLFAASEKKPEEDVDGYGREFENDVFHVFPYYWGDCTCGYEEREAEWCSNNPHKESCYQNKYKAIKYHWLDDKDKHKEEALKLCKELGIPWNNGIGSAAHCTCGHNKSWLKWAEENDHLITCPIVRPNFLYKPTNFSINWYKYPLRDAYKSQNISIAEFRTIVSKCIESIHKSELEAT